MASEATLDSLSLTAQVVLLGVAEVHRNGETPVQTHEIRQVCNSRRTDFETEVVGKLTEADVMRALYRLEDTGFVEEVRPAETSPTGKGRPAYTLGVDPDVVDAGLDDALRSDRDD